MKNGTVRQRAMYFFFFRALCLRKCSSSHSCYTELSPERALTMECSEASS